MIFNEETTQRVKQIIARYPEGKQKSALLPILHIAQENNGGWLNAETMDYVATILAIEKIEVYEVATFYSMYNHKPVGKHLFEICRTGPCNIEGAKATIAYIEKKLGVKEGEVTADGMFSFKTVECLGACGYAPMMQLGEHYREHLTEQKIDEIIEECKANSKN
jgi:NADH-quinone oxidoreductase subunit E